MASLFIAGETAVVPTPRNFVRNNAKLLAHVRGISPSLFFIFSFPLSFVFSCVIFAFPFLCLSVYAFLISVAVFCMLTYTHFHLRFLMPSLPQREI